MKSWPSDSLTDTVRGELWASTCHILRNHDCVGKHAADVMTVVQTQTQVVFEMCLSCSEHGRNVCEGLCLQFYNVVMTVEPTCTRFLIFPSVINRCEGFPAVHIWPFGPPTKVFYISGLTASIETAAVQVQNRNNPVWILSIHFTDWSDTLSPCPWTHCAKLLYVLPSKHLQTNKYTPSWKNRNWASAGQTSPNDDQPLRGTGQQKQRGF